MHFLCVSSNEVSPGFQLRVELYSSCVVDEFSPGAIGSWRVSRLGGSLGCSSGKKIRTALESAAVCGSISSGDVRSGSVPPTLSPDLLTLWAWHYKETFYGVAWKKTSNNKKKEWLCKVLSFSRGPKYNLLAHTTLRIEHVREGFKTHDLSLSATGESPVLSFPVLSPP